MTIKVKHIVLFIIVIIVAIISYRVLNQPLKEIFEKGKYEKQIVNYLNFESFENLSKGTIENYNYYKNYYDEPNIDISQLIESYIKQIETNERNPYSVGGLEVPLSSNFEREIQGYDYTDVLYVFYGKNRISSISELEKILIHKSNNKYSDWCIPKDSSNIIELPYNFYLKYESSDFKYLDDVKRVIGCTFGTSILEKSYNGEKKIKIEYIDKNNEKHLVSGTIYITDDGKIIFPRLGIYYSETHNAKIELKNHIADLLQDEYVRRGYANDLTWDFDWEREECKEMVKTVKEKLWIR